MPVVELRGRRGRGEPGRNRMFRWSFAASERRVLREAEMPSLDRWVSATLMMPRGSPRRRPSFPRSPVGLT